MKQLTNGSMRGIAFEGIQRSHMILGVVFCLAATTLIIGIQYLLS